MFILEDRRHAGEKMSGSSLNSSLFHENWWLDAASGGYWAEAAVRENGRLVARLPYVVKRQAGLVGLGMPPLTRTLGPEFAVAGGDGLPPDYRRLAAELVQQLPKYDYFTQICDPRISQTLPFYSLGFESSLSYTLRIPAGLSPEALRLAQRKQVRYDIARAQEAFSVHADIGMDMFCSFHNKWLKVNHNLWWSRSFEKRVDAAKLRLYEACKKHDCIAILGARDRHGALKAAAVLVWGHGVMYYWLTARDPDPETKGAAKLLISHAINLATSKRLAFDFDGFPRPSSVSMLSGFGGEVVNRITIGKFSLLAGIARGISSRLKFGL